ncbi:MAG: hypothetical protein OXP69_03815 [Spirochaetaceae bacterium]|nr:hypothetical protein [Spirochaetaceae bacterium]
MTYRRAGAVDHAGTFHRDQAPVGPAAACTRGGFSPELLEYGEVDEDEAHDFLHDFYGGVSV